MPWNEVYQRLIHFSKTNSSVNSLPPKPLILAGWISSNDMEKKNRWEETTQWAQENGCAELTDSISENAFYFVDEPTTYTVGPMGGPMYQSWDYEEKERPSPGALQRGLKILKEKWPDLIGEQLSGISNPLAFTGRKARRLLVLVKANCEVQPPWGGWAHLSNTEPERRTFTQFRINVNEAIAPLEVDHIDFIIDDTCEKGTA